MHLRRLELGNYRNYARLELPLQSGLVVFMGSNAQGKTNLLEAINYLATLKSPITSAERQLIGLAPDDSLLPYTAIVGDFTRGNENHTLELTLMNTPESDADGSRGIVRKQARLDGQVQRLIDCVGCFMAVLFLPKDVNLITGSPGERRRYLDISLCQQSRRYCRALSQYNRILGQRNALLHQIRERRASAHELEFWDEQIVELGAFLSAARVWLCAGLDARLQDIYPGLSEGRETLQLRYAARVLDDTEAHWNMAGSLDEATTPSALAEITQQLRQALQSAQAEEIARGMTVVGPHRDDLRFTLNDADAAEMSSRGQQRSIVVALKLAEAHLIHAHSGESPVVLLDDIFSELDHDRARLLVSQLRGIEQVLISTTDLNACDLSLLEHAHVYEVVAGHVIALAGH
ncbi:MAG: DNA replication/repair protein RecF [Chloroflexi bacterium]|nr:DNA replication/repair protein RecF [Chloroflexota bacterium]